MRRAPEVVEAALAALVGVDWRPLVGLPATADGDDPVERAVTLGVIERAHEFKQRELDYTAAQVARSLF